MELLLTENIETKSTKYVYNIKGIIGLCKSSKKTFVDGVMTNEHVKNILICHENGEYLLSTSDDIGREIVPVYRKGFSKIKPEDLDKSYFESNHNFGLELNDNDLDNINPDDVYLLKNKWDSSTILDAHKNIIIVSTEHVMRF